MEQQVREPQGGEAIVDVILRRAEGRVENSVFRKLLCDGNHNVLQVNILGEKRKKKKNPPLKTSLVLHSKFKTRTAQKWRSLLKIS